MLGLLSSVATFLPSVSLLVHRIHNTGRSGWWALLLIVPCAGVVAWLVLGLQAGEPRTNQWGPEVSV